MKVILFGATGMVGQGVLRECLLDSGIESVLAVGRNPLRAPRQPKLREILHDDFTDYSDIELQLTGYDARFFCLGVSSVGMEEERYRHLTYDVTLAAAKTLSRLNPQMVFVYVTGRGPDSPEQGRLMWARVKGKTENDLMKLPFKNVYAFRPGFMKPTPGLKNTLGGYTYLGWLFPVFNTFLPNYVSTLAQVGIAMIHTVTQGYEKQVLEVK